MIGDSTRLGKPQSYWRKLNEEDLLQIDGSHATLAMIFRGRYRYQINEVDEGLRLSSEMCAFLER